MTASAPAVADLLWGSGQGLAAALAAFPVPASILAAARNNQLVGNVWDTSGLDTYIGAGNGQFNGFPILNSQPTGAQFSSWDAQFGTITLNSSPPAGSPQATSILLTPGGSSQFPQAFSGGVNCFPNNTYSVSSFMFAVSAADDLNVGIDWYDGTNAAGGNFIKTTSADLAIVASTWQEITESFVSPPGAHIGLPWAGLFNATTNIPAGHTVNIAGIFCTTPYS
jgi:hypothetical protein